MTVKVDKNSRLYFKCSVCGSTVTVQAKIYLLSCPSCQATYLISLEKNSVLIALEVE